MSRRRNFNPDGPVDIVIQFLDKKHGKVTINAQLDDFDVELHTPVNEFIPIMKHERYFIPRFGKFHPQDNGKLFTIRTRARNANKAQARY